MPLLLPPVSRRRFLFQSIAAACSGGVLMGDDKPDSASAEKFWTLFSDSHIAADRTTISKGINMTDHLTQCVAEALAMPRTSSGVMVSGDLAFFQGVTSDYENFSGLMQPLREKGLPVYLMFGNHDDRAQAVTAFANEPATPAPVEDKHVTVIEDALASWFLLDSLNEVNKPPGLLGDAQLAWLTKELDARKDKPAIVMVHHNVLEQPNKGSLQDAAAFLAVVRPRTHVKAVIYGHTHLWSVKADSSGIHLINLPATAYAGSPEIATGWVHAALRKDGLKLELHCIDHAHPQHGEIKDLPWRAA